MRLLSVVVPLDFHRLFVSGTSKILNSIYQEERLTIQQQKHHNKVIRDLI